MQTHCENCGQTSHCGTALLEEHKNYNEPPITIKICHHCRCGDCTPINKENKHEF